MMKSKRVLYSAETLMEAGIPIHLTWSKSHRAAIVNLRTAICFILTIRLKQPQLYVADMLEISQVAVSKHIKRHYQNYPDNKDYSSIYLSAVLALEIAGILKSKAPTEPQNP